MRIYLSTWPECSQGVTLTKAKVENRLLSYFFLRECSDEWLKKYFETGIGFKGHKGKEKMSNIWFTADWHYNHKNIIKYCNRPFANIDEMNKTLIDNFKKLVKSNDTLYFLGDLSFSREDFALLNIFTLPHKTIFIRGNHDRFPNDNKKLYDVYDQKTINIEGQIIVLNHYCMRRWDRSHYNSWHLYAHSHGTLDPIGKSWDVGVDNNNFKPISFYEIKEIMAKRPDNSNLVVK